MVATMVAIQATFPAEVHPPAALPTQFEHPRRQGVLMLAMIRSWISSPTAWLAAAAVAVAGLFAANFSSPAGAQTAAGQPRFFEMRIYTANEGKLEDLHK